MKKSKSRSYLIGRKRGDVIQGVVLSTHAFGCVLSLGGGVDALLELVEIPSPLPLKMSDLPQPGEELEVHLNAYDSERDQIYVSLRDLDWEKELTPRNRIPPVDESR